MLYNDMIHDGLTLTSDNTLMVKCCIEICASSLQNPQKTVGSMIRSKHYISIYLCIYIYYILLYIIYLLLIYYIYELFIINYVFIIFSIYVSIYLCIYISTARDRVSKSCLMAALFFHRFLHFDCVSIYIFGFHHKQCANDQKDFTLEKFTYQLFSSADESLNGEMRLLL